MDKPPAKTDLVLTTIDHHVQFHFAADSATIWLSLTTAQGLQNWLAQEADVNLKVGGDFSIYSKFPTISGRHRVLEIDKQKRLTLELYTDGMPTELTFSLEEKAAGGTLVKLSHVADRSPTNATWNGYIRLIWDVALARLRIYTETGSQGATINAYDWDETVRLSIAIEGSVESVWKAITDIDTIRIYENPKTDNHQIDLKLGGRFSWGWEDEESGTDGPGYITELVDQQTIEVSWNGPTDSEKIRWTLEANGASTVIVHFSHTNISQRGSAWGYRLGWCCGLHTLKWFVENGDKASDWDNWQNTDGTNL